MALALALALAIALALPLPLALTLPQAFYRLNDTTSGARLRALGARPGDTAIDLARKLAGRDRFVSLLTRLQGEARSPLPKPMHVPIQASIL